MLGVILKLQILCAAILLTQSVQAFAGSSVHVVDGDTVDVGVIRYRLHGIDAPEAGQLCAGRDGGTWTCGQDAIRHMEEIIDGKSVECDDRSHDAYGRTIAVCVAGGVEINALMVEQGFAWAFRKYSQDYVETEEAARKRGVGIWQAATEPAWDFRARKWEASLSAAPDRTCPIKGNINRKQEHIYHVPWSRDYGRTKVNVAKGERWFCSEEEAIAAGWRAPLWGR